LIYTGFLQWQHVMNSNVVFEPMSCNRAINDDVVDRRVKDNLEHMARTGKFCDFGQINLLVLLDDPAHKFYVMDGQHRCKTMARLHSQTGKDIKFQFRAKAVANESGAHQELLHFQSCYPSDSRSFFATAHARHTATAVLQRLRTEFPSVELWSDVITTTCRAGKRTGDPNRPRLNDFLVFWILQDSGLLDAVSPDNGEREIFQTMLRMNRLLRRVAQTDRNKIGKGVTENMLRIAERTGCYLGLFRDDGVGWSDFGGRLGEESAAAADTQDSFACVVCLAADRNILFRPCRHLCCCGECGRQLATCPVCNKPVEEREQIFVS